MTIPRLELLAVTIGVRAAKFVAKELKFSFINRILWTDSICVLHWLKTNKQLPLFVENRVAEIKRASDIIFHYISSDQNPADLPTRGLFANELSDATLWWHGSRWLKCFGLSGVSLRLHLRLLRKPRLILRLCFMKWLHLLVKPVMMKDLLSVR